MNASSRPERERTHYEGDDCNPPHVILAPELSAEHAEALAALNDDSAWPPHLLQAGLTGDEAVTELTRIGYGTEESNFAVARAMVTVAYPLRDHYVRHHRDPDRFDIGTIVPVPGPLAPSQYQPPDRGGGYHADGGVPAILNSIEVVDAHLDEAGPQWAKDCPEANMYRRVGKAQSEATEAMDELSLLTGENPRKGQDPEARDRMLAELGDTAVAALLGIQSQVKDTAVTWQVFLAALAKAHDRVRRHAGQLPPETGMTRQAAEDAEQGMK